MSSTRSSTTTRSTPSSRCGVRVRGRDLRLRLSANTSTARQRESVCIGGRIGAIRCICALLPCRRRILRSRFSSPPTPRAAEQHHLEEPQRHAGPLAAAMSGAGLCETLSQDNSPVHADAAGPQKLLVERSKARHAKLVKLKKKSNLRKTVKNRSVENLISQ